MGLLLSIGGQLHRPAIAERNRARKLNAEQRENVTSHRFKVTYNRLGIQGEMLRDYHTSATVTRWRRVTY